MNKVVGKVIEVYIPEQYKNNGLLDVMDRTIIGFKVETDNGIKDVVFDQDELTASIMKNDLVWLVYKVESEEEFISILPYEEF